MSKNASAEHSNAVSSRNDEKANDNVGKTGISVNGTVTPIMLPDGYRPTEDEEFMNPMQLLYFQKKLEAWKAELLDDATGTITGLSQENLHQPDQMDRAQIESNAALDLRTRDRERKLLQKIEAALRRIETVLMAIVLKLMSQSIYAGLKRDPLRHLACTLRSGTNAWSVSTVMISWCSYHRN